MGFIVDFLNGDEDPATRAAADQNTAPYVPPEQQTPAPAPPPAPTPPPAPPAPTPVAAPTKPTTPVAPTVDPEIQKREMANAAQAERQRAAKAATNYTSPAGLLEKPKTSRSAQTLLGGG